MPRAHHLAQLNVGRLVAPLDDPRIADFVADLDRINALADAHPGFVWRLQDDAGAATSYRLFDDSTLVNMSVWETIQAVSTRRQGSTPTSGSDGRISRRGIRESASPTDLSTSI